MTEAIEEKRRAGDFVERISTYLIFGAFAGGFIVLLDLKLTLTIYEQVIQIGGEGYSPELKGVVVQSMLITGFAAVVAFWLGTTKQGQDQAKSVNKIAEAAAPAQAVAVAAARAPVPDVPLAAVPSEPAVTPAPINPATGVIPAVEVVSPKDMKP